MRRLQDLFCLVLPVLLLMGPGAVDLCACSDSGHGAFCDEPQAAESSCCSAPADDAEAHQGCDCPVFDLEDPTPKVDASEAPPVLSGATIPSAFRVAVRLPQPFRSVDCEPRPPPLRRHLLLNVFLC